ncbi:hypothetical protein NPX13_g8044 [Xylaria arbuscula]|uniref:Uncharacterized protein n=1 Tax=Xylaria arbuscula TaxID=114810 RepID=A0A9W8TIY3_9PEZI|nr:hypothetical protein NPX13_g8044 [Xylaria arbuscula]
MRTLVSPASLTEKEPLPALADQTQRHQGDDTAKESHNKKKQNHNHEEDGSGKGNGNNPIDIIDMIPSPSRDGTPWAKTWTSLQKSSILSRPHKFRPTTVVYGHDAKAGLQLRKYTFGLDSGCGSDKALTGMIFEMVPGSGGHASGTRNKQHQQSPEEEEEENRRIKQEGRAEDESESEQEDGEGIELLEQQGHARIRHRLVSVPCS